MTWHRLHWWTSGRPRVAGQLQHRPCVDRSAEPVAVAGELDHLVPHPVEPFAVAEPVRAGKGPARDDIDAELHVGFLAQDAERFERAVRSVESAAVQAGEHQAVRDVDRRSERRLAPADIRGIRVEHLRAEAPDRGGGDREDRCVVPTARAVSGGPAARRLAVGRPAGTTSAAPGCAASCPATLAAAARGRPPGRLPARGPAASGPAAPGPAALDPLAVDSFSGFSSVMACSCAVRAEGGLHASGSA